MCVRFDSLTYSHKVLPRPPISISIETAAPETAEPAANNTTPTKVISFLPKTSAMLPLKGIIAADAKEYADDTQMKLLESPRSETMVGAAVPIPVF